MTEKEILPHRNKLTKALNKFGSLLLSPLECAIEYFFKGDKYLPICFILGPPRSGTTLLYELLTTQFHCAYFSNLTERAYRIPIVATWFSREAMRKRQGSFDSDLGFLGGFSAPSESGRVWRHWMPQAAPYYSSRPGLNPAQIRTKIATLCALMKGPMIAKNIFFESEIETLYEMFPNALFIHLERDWKNNVRSILKGRENRLPFHSSGWWSVRPTGWEHFSDADAVLQSCAQVFLIHDEISKSLRKLDGEQSIRVKYEDICTYPSEVLTQIENLFKKNGVMLIRKQPPPEPFTIAPSRKLDKTTEEKIARYFDELGFAPEVVPQDRTSR